MTAAVILVAAITPGIFWLWFFTRGRSYHPRPRRLLVGTFFLGAMSTVPAGLIEFALIPADSWGASTAIGAVAFVMFFIVGPVEETSKFLAVRFGAFRTGYFEEPLDGLIYSTAASLGFASAENVLYAITYGPEVMIVRGPLSTVAHLVFGAAWGLALGLRARRRGFSALTLLGLAGAAITHGAFNVSAAAGLPLLAIALVVIGALVVARMYRWAQRVSPFRLRRNVPLVACRVCHNEYRLGSRFCSQCGSPASDDDPALICGNCRKISRADARFCVSCGDRFVKRPS
ncbi:MAG: PrsW family glutamic-type intramembrane protease [Dehalococcoidia bacterium]